MIYALIVGAMIACLIIYIIRQERKFDRETVAIFESIRRQHNDRIKSLNKSKGGSGE